MLRTQKNLEMKIFWKHGVSTVVYTSLADPNLAFLLETDVGLLQTKFLSGFLEVAFCSKETKFYPNMSVS